MPETTRERDVSGRIVVRVDPSPMNPRVKIAELSCGHDLYITPPKRAPRVGKAVDCPKCEDIRRLANHE